MNINKMHESPVYEPDERKREKMMFSTPFLAHMLEGGFSISHTDKASDVDVSLVAILSSN